MNLYKPIAMGIVSHITAIKVLIAASIAAALLMSLIHPLISQAGEEKARRTDGYDAADREKGDDSEVELEFDGVQPKSDKDPSFVDELYDIVKYQQVRENVSGGLTSKGLNFTVEW